MKNEDLLKESIHLILNYHGRSIIIKLKKYKVSSCKTKSF